MKKKVIANERGFTMVEVLFAIMIGVLLLGAIYAAVQSGQRSSVAIESKVASQQDVRAALELMSMETGMASYNPTATPGASIWVNLANPNDPSGQHICDVTPGPPFNSAGKGIIEATANSITFEADLNGDGIIGSAQQPNNEVIRYSYVTTGSDQFITRCSCCTTGNSGTGRLPLLGASVASGIPRTVKVVNNNLNIRVFTYFDGSGTQLPANPISPEDPLPSDIPNIRRVDITLAVETNEIDPNTGQPRTMIYSNSVVPVNLAISQ